MEMAVDLRQQQSNRPLKRANPRESRGRKANEANAFREGGHAGRVAGGSTGKSDVQGKNCTHLSNGRYETRPHKRSARPFLEYVRCLRHDRRSGPRNTRFTPRIARTHYAGGYPGTLASYLVEPTGDSR